MEDSEKKSKPSFFQGVKMEFDKIVWPDAKATFKQSVAVVVISVVVGLVIAMLDYWVLEGVNKLTSIPF